jgi:hypothetical protein
MMSYAASICDNKCLQILDANLAELYPMLGFLILRVNNQSTSLRFDVSLLLITTSRACALAHTDPDMVITWVFEVPVDVFGKEFCRCSLSGNHHAVLFWEYIALGSDDYFNKSVLAIDCNRGRVARQHDFVVKGLADFYRTFLNLFEVDYHSVLIQGTCDKDLESVIVPMKMLTVATKS